MSNPSVKWIPGAPKQLKVGMVLRAGSRVFLVGSPMVGDSMEFSDGLMLDGKPVDSHGQLVDAYVLEWLGNDGIVKGVSR